MDNKTTKLDGKIAELADALGVTIRRDKYGFYAVLVPGLPRKARDSWVHPWTRAEAIAAIRRLAQMKKGTK